MAVLLSAGVFVKGNVEAPVLCVLDAPVFADGLGDGTVVVVRMTSGAQPESGWQ